MKKIHMTLWGVIFVLPSLVGVLLFYIFPFAINMVYSLSKSVSKFEYIGFRNYEELFSTPAFCLSFKNTLYFMFFCIIFLLLFGNSMAFFFDYVTKKRMTLAGLVMMGSILPMIIPTGTILVFLKKIFSDSGIWNSVKWMTTDAAFVMLLLIFLWKNVGYCMLIIYTGIHTIPTEIFEAAKMEGANKRQIYIYMILPHIKSFVSFSIIMGINGIFKSYRESYLLLGEYPQEKVYMLQNYLNNNFYSLNYQRLTTASIVFVIIMVVILGGVFVGGNRYDA